MNIPIARVLIVDDEVHSQMRIQFSLEQAGFQCDLAADGQEALERLQTGRYHAIVTELILPNTQGGEFIMQLCALDRKPIVIVHTRTLEHDVYCGLKSEGVDAIFYKPVDYTSMARSIRRLVESRMVIAKRNWARSENSAIAGSNVAKIFAKGDEWIQRSTLRVEAFRMMIMLLACILFGLGWGNSLDSQMAGICKMFGLCGFAFYFCLELVAYHRERHRARLVKWVAERRLSQHVEIQVEESQAYSDPGAPAGVLPLASAGHRD